MLFFGNSGAKWTIEDNYFAKGGEGELHNLADHKDLVAKIYKDGVLNATRQEKLIYMSSIYSSERLQQLAWPKDVLKDAAGNVKGFIMRRFSATKDLADLLDGSSNNSGHHLDWLKRIVIALNLSHLVNEIHSLGQVIGDMNPKNFGVDMSNGFVCAFDTDSFHLRDASTGKWYPCTVLDEHYIAPEFQARLKQGGRVDSFRPEETFTRETDHFALAVLIFQLLFNGVHPFTAARVPSRGSSVVIHTRETNIYQRMSPFFNPSPNTMIPVYAPPLSIVPDRIRAMFQKAFLQDARPTAQEWAAELSALVLQTEKCSNGHYYGRYNSSCPWCAMEEKAKKAKAAHAASSSTGSASAATQTPPPAPYTTPPTVPTKKTYGWGFIAAVIAILVIAVYAMSGSNDTGNGLETGYGTENQQVYQSATPKPTRTVKPTATPTPKRTPTPTPKPTATPVPREFSFDRTFKNTNGIIRISWTDSKWRSPYTVTYQYINDSSSVQQTNYRLGTTYTTYMDCAYFIPGSKYLITVTDADGASAKTTFTYSPPSSFQDGKLKASSISLSIAPRSISSSAISSQKWSSAKSCKFSAQTMEANIRLDLEHYGLYTKIAYPKLEYSRTYNTLFAYYAPNGYVISYEQEVTYERKYSYWYWNIIYGYFDDLYREFEKIPVGNYTVKLFFNGQLVDSQSFYVDR